MLASPPVRGTPCRFKTAYPVSIWPVEVTGAVFNVPPPASPHLTARTVLKLSLKTIGGVPFSALREKISDVKENVLDRLRFFLQHPGTWC